MELKRTIVISIFWGALWGIAEATLGSLLHAVNLGIGWLIWFPAAYYFMYKVFKKTGSCESVLLISLIAAVIKLVDLFLPVRIDMVINPAFSILLEGLVVYAVFKIHRKYFNPVISENYGMQQLPASFIKSGSYEFIGLAVMSFLWRLLYSAYVSFLPAWMAEISPVRGLAPFIRFLIFEGTINFLTIFFILKIYTKFNLISAAVKTNMIRKIIGTGQVSFFKENGLLPFTAAGFFIIALLVQWMI